MFRQIRLHRVSGHACSRVGCQQRGKHVRAKRTHHVGLAYGCEATCAERATSALFSARMDVDQMPTPVAPPANTKIATLAMMILC